MLFRQITHDDLGCASYPIGDTDAGVAAVAGVGTWERQGNSLKR